MLYPEYDYLKYAKQSGVYQSSFGPMAVEYSYTHTHGQVNNITVPPVAGESPERFARRVVQLIKDLSDSPNALPWQ